LTESDNWELNLILQDISIALEFCSHQYLPCVHQAWINVLILPAYILLIELLLIADIIVLNFTIQIRVMIDEYLLLWFWQGRQLTRP